MALKIVERSTSDLIPYANNSRRHSDEQVAQIAASIREFGWTNPVLIDGENGIIAGHGRVLAAQRLGMRKVPTIELAHLTANQRRAYVIADNKLALNAGWDMDLLKLELGNLQEFNFDLSLIGFDPGELASIFLEREDGETDAEAEWDGMPEFDQQDKKPHRTLHVHFASDEDVETFAQAVGQKITDKTRFLWFPEIVIETYADKRYVEDA